MTRPRASLWAWVGGAAVAQEMRGACVSCGDVARKCRLECVAPPDAPVVDDSGRPGLGVDPDACAAACDAVACVEDPRATACFGCVDACAAAYETAMLDCLRGAAGGTPDVARTFAVGGDACAVATSAVMDACVDACHPREDHATAWTPEAEDAPFDARDDDDEAAAPPAAALASAAADAVPGHLAFLSLGFLGVALVVVGVLLQCRAAPGAGYVAVAAYDGGGDDSDDDGGDAPQ